MRIPLILILLVYKYFLSNSFVKFKVIKKMIFLKIFYEKNIKLQK